MTWKDGSGCRYEVKPGLGSRTWKGFCLRPGDNVWRNIVFLPWQTEKEVAEVQLKEYARKRGWTEA